MTSRVDLGDGSLMVDIHDGYLRPSLADHDDALLIPQMDIGWRKSHVDDGALTAFGEVHDCQVVAVADEAESPTRNRIEPRWFSGKGDAPAEAALPKDEESPLLVLLGALPADAEAACGVIHVHRADGAPDTEPGGNPARIRLNHGQGHGRIRRRRTPGRARLEHVQPSTVGRWRPAHRNPGQRDLTHRAQCGGIDGAHDPGPHRSRHPVLKDGQRVQAPTILRQHRSSRRVREPHTAKETVPP